MEAADLSPIPSAKQTQSPFDLFLIFAAANVVATTMQTIAEAEIGESMMEKVTLFRSLLARTPVDHLNVKERPAIHADART